MGLSAGLRPAPATIQSNSNSNSNSRSWFPEGWRGGSGCGRRRKPFHGGLAAASLPRTLPQPDPSRLRQFPAICRDGAVRCCWWVSTLVDTVDPRHAWMTHSISERKIVSTKVDTYQQPRGTKPQLPTTARNLSEAGRCGLAGPLAPWMAPSSPHGRVYGVSCQPTPPRHPSDSPLLLLPLLSLRSLRVQGAALPNTPYFRGR